MDPYWQDKNVFITGCTGILGSWMSIRLLKAGAHVVGLIRDQVPNSNLHRSGFQEKMDLVHGDITDYDLLERALAEYEIDTVFHLAAQTIVGIANRVPRPTFEANIKGSWNILEAARQNPTVRRIVVASTDKAYGDQPELPYTEEQPLLARYPYDVSKAAADMIARSYYHSFGLPVAVTRLGNIYGGGDLNWNRIVPGTLRSIYRGQNPVIRSDGTPERDYLYVQDAVTAYLVLAQALDRPEVQGKAFNFSPEAPISALALVQLILRLTGEEDLRPVIMSQGKIKGEIDRQYLSSQRARQMLNWQPQYSLEEGLRESIAWYWAFFQEQQS